MKRLFIGQEIDREPLLITSFVYLRFWAFELFLKIQKKTKDSWKHLVERQSSKTGDQRENGQTNFEVVENQLQSCAKHQRVVSLYY